MSSKIIAEFTTIDEQIEILKNRHLLFNDESIAKDLLQIYSLFHLDSELRYSVLTSMLSLEEHLRSVTSYVIGEHFGSDESIYLKRENYKDRAVANQKFSLDSILKTMHQALYSQRYPILYHRQKYNNVPPWILVKGIYMNTLINFI